MVFLISALVEIDRCSNKRCCHALDTSTSNIWDFLCLHMFFFSPPCLPTWGWRKHISLFYLAFPSFLLWVSFLFRCLLIISISPLWSGQFFHLKDTPKRIMASMEFWKNSFLRNDIHKLPWRQWSSKYNACSEGFPKLFVEVWENILKFIFLSKNMTEH